MPLLITEDWRTYWNYQVLSLSKGDEIPDGEFAAHLLATGAPVESTAAAVAGDGVPDGNVAQVLAWVGDDLERARLALDTEAAGKNRAGITGPLGKLLEAKGSDDADDES
jgi:hypothetical protein